MSLAVFILEFLLMFFITSTQALNGKADMFGFLALLP